MAYTLTEFKKSEFSKKPHFFVVGHPVEHSLSPAMHQYALDYHNIEANYLALNLLPNEFAEFVSWLNKDKFLGCNITIPYKEQFANTVDVLDDYAIQAGVINTIAKSGSRLIGHNTDIHGFTAPLLNYIDELEGGVAIVFGTGGASKAVRIGLETLGMEEVIYVSRNPQRAGVQSNALYSKTVGYSEWQAYADDAALIVNTTPLGMHPNVQNSPVDERDVQHLSGNVCYDLVYNPLETTFLKQAKGVGAEVVDGLDMLIHQGNRSFEIWTGKSFPFEEVKTLLVNRLSG
ncbi:shikimate dehydrogenase [Rhodohalobacter halophilus]|uniref:shikimate dehydrogenase n=1 Tax=Rhodohalobacter halophilus TaxID=1812810 RepID=UPI000A0079E8|nr:shikimate dehydrogenase [Rhodohalobacter halophilus]